MNDGVQRIRQARLQTCAVTTHTPSVYITYTTAASAHLQCRLQLAVDHVPHLHVVITTAAAFIAGG